MKKILALLLALVMVVSMVACGGNNDDGPAADTPAADAPAADTPAVDNGEETITLRLLYMSADQTQQTMMKEYIEPGLAEAFPDVEIVIEEGGGSDSFSNLVKTYNSSGDLPDVFWASADVTPAIIEAGNIMDLTDIIVADGFADKFQDPDALKDSKGKVFAINQGTDPMHIPVMYYNKAIFAKYGLEAPTTWEEFSNVCDTLVANGVAPISFCGAEPSRRAFYVEALITAIDPSVTAALYNGETDWSDPVCVQAYQMLKEMMDKGWFNNGYEATDHATHLDIFSNDQAAMIYEMAWLNGNWNADEVGVFLFPSLNENIETGTYVQCWGGPYNGWGVNANTEHPELAVKLAEYCVEQQARYFNENGTASNYVTDVVMGEPVPLLGQINALRDASDTRLKFIFANSMDAATVAEWHTMNSTFVVGGYTPEEICEEFNEIYAENTWFN